MRMQDKRSATGASSDRMRPNECEIDENKHKRFKKQCVGLQANTKLGKSRSDK